MTKILVLGGARSGKSAFAEALLAGAETLDYLAAAMVPSDDHEWTARVAAHRLRRPASWRTVETGDIAGQLSTGESPVLIDSITSWLTRVMDDAGSWTSAADRGGADPALDAALARLVVAWTSTAREVVAVSDEVGLGVVPESASGRLFRDTLGLLNQRLAAAADTVYYVVAGLPHRLK